jgi:hypothetical protein
MGSLLSLSTTTAVLCGIWSYVSGIVGLLGWAGFSGCTSYFASGGKKEGLKASLIANTSGVIWAMIAIKLSPVLGIQPEIAGSIMTTIITFGMCIQAKSKLFAYIPGTFFGSFSTFAANGDWKLILPSLLLGGLLGHACQCSGDWLFNLTNKKSEEVEKNL